MVYALRCKHLHVERKRAPRWSTSLDRRSLSLRVIKRTPTVRVSHINNHYTTDKSYKHNRYRVVNCFTDPWRNSYYWNIGDCWLRSGKAGFNTIWLELLYTSHTFISCLMNQAVFIKCKKGNCRFVYSSISNVKIPEPINKTNYNTVTNIFVEWNEHLKKAIY